jgi:hypothetical protein
MNNLFKKYKLLPTLLVTILLLRLLLSGDRDILALNQPIDDFWFVSKALNWGGLYTNMSSAQLPTYSLWLTVNQIFGVSGRLAIDLLWILSSAYLGYSLSKLLKSVYVGLIVYFYLAFHPYSIVLFDRALSENFLAALTALALAGFIELCSLRESKYILSIRSVIAWISVTLVFAIAYHTRKEGIVLLPPIFFLGCVILFDNKKILKHPFLYLHEFLPIVFSLVMVIIFGLILAGLNYYKWGTFARYDLAAPEYVRAINTLNAVRPEIQTPKHVTVTAQTRVLAYAQSPTFSELKPYLDGEMGQEVARTTEIYGAPGEIANGWFYWVIREAAARAGWYVNSVTSEAKYRAMSQELENAFNSGQLAKRRVILSFIDPDLAKWLPDLPTALITQLKLLIFPGSATLSNALPEDANLIQFNDYIRLLGRRNSLPYVQVSGWATLPEGSCVALGNDKFAFSWKPLDGPLRPDVNNAHSFELVSEGLGLATHFWARQDNGIVLHLPLSDLHEGDVTVLPSITGGLVGVDRFSGSRLKRKADDLIFPISKIWDFFGFIFILVGWIIFFTSFFQKNTAIEKAALVLSTCCLLAITARILLIALLDASSWGGQQARYLLPVVPFFAVFGAIGVWITLQRVFKLLTPIKSKF